MEDSTRLGERLDLEALTRVMMRYFESMAAIIERHGGIVAKFQGDAVMAVFGIPAVSEDDALRAVRAALAMHAALPTLNEELNRRWGVTIETRTGINTGEVLTGTLTALENLVVGDAANIAARLQQAADPGQILIGDRTHRLVRDAIVTESAGPLAVKGKRAPMSAHRVLTVGSAKEGQGLGFASPMVGRERELLLLREAAQEVMTTGSSRCVAVLGSAGVGKSRLVQEFLLSVPTMQAVFGRCLAYGDGITFWPIAEMVKRSAAIAEDEPLEESRRRIASIVGGDEAQRVADHLAHAIGLAGTPRMAGETFWAVRMYLEALARRGPLIVVFDDLHRAEPTLLDLIDHVVDRSSAAPILTVCLSRPELRERRPTWPEPPAVPITLEPLGEDDVDRLLDTLFDPGGAPAEAGSWVRGIADGNPLFVEQAVSMLMDDGLVRREGSMWKTTRHLSLADAPPSISALLTARLDRLDTDQRSVLEASAVVGERFDRASVAELAGHQVPSIGEILGSLEGKDLIRQRSAMAPWEEDFTFRHLLIRDAAYQGIPKEERVRLHERFATYIEGSTGQRITEYEEIVGHHLEQAHRYLTELGPEDDRGRLLAERGSSRLASSGVRAYLRGDGPGAASLLEHSVSLLRPADPARVEILADLYRSYLDTGDYVEKGLPVLGEFVSLAESSADERIRVWGMVGRLLLTRFLDTATATGMLEETQEALDSVRRSAGENLADCYAAFGGVLWSMGQAGRAAEVFEAGVRAAREQGRAGALMECLYYLAYAIGVGPTPIRECIDRLKGMPELAGGSRKIEALSLVHQGLLEAQRADFELARSLLADGKGLFEDLDVRRGYAAAAACAGGIELLAGDLTAAERELRWGHDILARSRDAIGAGLVAAPLAEALYQQGRLDEAWEWTIPCMETPWLECQIRWRTVQARIHAARGELEEAERCAREGLEVADATDFANDRGDARMAIAEILLRAGRSQEAATYARQARSLHEQKGNLVSAARAGGFMAPVVR